MKCHLDSAGTSNWPLNGLWSAVTSAAAFALVFCEASASASAGDTPAAILSATDALEMPVADQPQARALPIAPVSRPASVASSQFAVPGDAELLRPANSDWRMLNRTYAGDRCAPLAQINATNALRLQPVCIDWFAHFTATKPVGRKPGSLYLEAESVMEPVGLASGWTYAPDAATGKGRWAIHAARPMIGAGTPPAGGIVFTGGGGSMFLTLDQCDGKVLCRFNTGGAIGGGVATYLVGERQYVAVATGGLGIASYGVDGGPAMILIALSAGTN